MRSRGEDLSRPRRPRRGLGIHYDPRPSATSARPSPATSGTARFLVIQTVVVAIWIFLNVALITLRWDPYPFILLNLAFSTQAAYAAPLILLAQNRQEQRDRAQAETDRRVAERTQADAEFLAREIAGVRLALGDMVTTEDLDDRLREAHRRRRAPQPAARLDSPPGTPPRARPGEPRSRRAAG